MTPEAAVQRAAGSLSVATAILVSAGAGMSTASGLVDYADPSNAVWPHAAQTKLEMAPSALGDARWFRVHPGLAWGFAAARLERYRVARPHPGFAAVLRWTEAARDGAFVFTSQPDGQFQRARFFADRIVEARGTLEWLQCTAGASGGCGEPFPGGLLDVPIDDATGFAEPPFPVCPRCGKIARPNVLLSEDDREWNPWRANEQEDRMNSWLAELRGRPGRKVVVVELGAARDALVQKRGERVAAAMGGTLVRIGAGVKGDVAVPMEIREGILAVDRELARLTRR
jgi:NAD-dependent SIR2 family protein deacetylase